MIKEKWQFDLCKIILGYIARNKEVENARNNQINWKR
jgi:hypothetical protein